MAAYMHTVYHNDVTTMLLVLWCSFSHKKVIFKPLFRDFSQSHLLQCSTFTFTVVIFDPFKLFVLKMIDLIMEKTRGNRVCETTALSGEKRFGMFIHMPPDRPFAESALECFWPVRPPTRKRLRTDRQTDRQTDRHANYCISEHEHLAKPLKRPDQKLPE